MKIVQCIKIVGSFLCCGFLGACGGGIDKSATDGSDGDAPFSITIQPDWFPQPEQGGFFMAMAAGYYSDAGLDVTFFDAAPNVPFLQKVAKGDATVGFTRLDLLAEAVEKGLPLVAIGKYSEHAPSGIMVPADSDIMDFSDLDGKRVMATIFAPYVDYLQAHFDIKMNLIPHNWGMAQFMSGELDAQQCYITSEPYHIERNGMKVRTLVVADTGYDPPHVIYTSKAVLESHKEELLAFYAATMDGWKEYLEGDPASAHKLIVERNPKMDAAFMEWSHSVFRDEGLVWGRQPEIRAGWGQLSKHEVRELVQQLRDIDALSELDPDDASWIDYDFQWTESPSH